MTLEWRSGGDADLVDGLLDKQVARPAVTLPAVCPVCDESAVHLFWHEDKERRGVGWAWCSACRRYGHAQWRIPAWWSNAPEIPLRLLTVVPVLLDEISEVVDTHWNNLKDSLDTAQTVTGHPQE